jgi:hypothetical protein
VVEVLAGDWGGDFEEGNSGELKGTQEGEWSIVNGQLLIVNGDVDWRSRCSNGGGMSRLSMLVGREVGMATSGKRGNLLNLLKVLMFYI